MTTKAKQPLVFRIAQVGFVLLVIGALTRHVDTPTAQAESPAPAVQHVNPAAWSSADRAAPVESDGVIDTEFEKNIGMLDYVVISVKASGHRCDSVFVASLSGKGTHLICNSGAYTYDFVKAGDEWVVKLD